MKVSKEKNIIHCCIKNCQKAIKIKDAIKIGDSYYCKTCGVAFYRSMLNI
ncbi:MAG: hypothetical protein ACTSUN_04900 [Promethearchaeota archaeon]